MREITIKIDYGANEFYVFEQGSLTNKEFGYYGTSPEQISASLASYLKQNTPQPILSAPKSKIIIPITESMLAAIDKITHMTKEQIKARYDAHTVASIEFYDLLDCYNVLAAANYLGVPCSSIRALAYSEDANFFTVYFNDSCRTFEDHLIFDGGIIDTVTKERILYPRDFKGAD